MRLAQKPTPRGVVTLLVFALPAACEVAAPPAEDDSEVATEVIAPPSNVPATTT